MAPAGTLLKLVLAAIAAISAAAAPIVSFNQKVDSRVVSSFGDSAHQDVLVKMTNDLNPSALVARKNFANRAARTTFVYEVMKARMMENHASVHAFLAEQPEHYFNAQSFWITNSLFIQNADAKLIAELSQREDVVGIFPNEIIPLEVPLMDNQTPIDQVEGVEWCVAKVQAPNVWASGNTGEGITVGIIDTGVRHTHESLVKSYRGTNADGTYTHDYNFFDGRGGAPVDTGGHGTHVMGSIVGSNGIGVAPGAKWVAAIGCRGFGCSTADLTNSAQWMTCPTNLAGQNADCSKAPHVINNSWGGGQGDMWYQSYIDAWHAAGIIPVFAQGNSGSACGTANSPGDSISVIGVGASNVNNAIASFSSRGPAKQGHMKPDIAAPGENIRSAAYSADNAYTVMSGTSMAAPHTAGVIALILAEKDLIYDDVMTIVATTAATSGLTADKDCGGVSKDAYPNNSWGHGLINACASVNKVNPGKAACAAPAAHAATCCSDACETACVNAGAGHCCSERGPFCMCWTDATCCGELNGYANAKPIRMLKKTTIDA